MQDLCQIAQGGKTTGTSILPERCTRNRCVPSTRLHQGHAPENDVVKERQTAYAPDRMEDGKMADIVVKAGYATVTAEDGRRFVGFVDPKRDDYVLFSQALDGGPIWFEVNDEGFGAEDALDALTLGPLGLEATIRPALSGRFGYAGTVAVRLKTCEGAEAALTALREMGLTV
jgi:hypothetical protein